MFEWDKKKSLELKKKHGFSFEEVVKAIEEDFVIIDSPNRARSQKAFLTFVAGYPVIVPFERRGELFRLITAWPDRRYK